MCGIVGLYRPEGILGEDREMVAASVVTLRHRGPDGVGYWAGSKAAFGHARLSIIDLATGDQPLFNEDGSVCVILNGEIYNYRELALELRQLGHVFRSRSDTEVIVHGYEEWGLQVVDRLDGMFAFALWDEHRQRLVLARDRFGEKPLYYTRLREQPGSLWFGSEIKALLAHREVERTLAEEHLGEYLLYRNVVAPATLFRGILQVRPGHLMVVEAGEAKESRYYDQEATTASSPSPDEEVDALLGESVTRRLMSDVQLGTVLSGGLDSSLVSSLAARARDHLDTFCVGFADARFDERPYARAVAQAIRSTHHELVVEASDITRELPRLTWANDEPLTHPNSIAMHLVFDFAKREHGVTVLLSGEGADEVFGGYDWYRALLRRERVARWPGIGLAARVIPGSKGSLLRRLLHPDYPLVANALAPRALAARLHRSAGAVPASRRALWPAGRPGLPGMFIYDQRTYLQALLQRQDRMSMAAGVEARVVFLSHPLVEWANRLPPARKVSAAERKIPLRRMASRLLPPALFDRPKVGFALPLRDWMAPGGGLADRVAALTSSSAFVSAYCANGAIARLVTEQHSGHDHSDMLWTLLALEEWSRMFLGSSLQPTELPGARSSLLVTGA